MNLGNWQLDTVSGGTLRLDGGAMFGVVPKPVWNRYQMADDQNRIKLATNCVLARDGSSTVLIDTGYGSKGNLKEQEQMALDAGDVLLANLAALGIAPEDIDWRYSAICISITPAVQRASMPRAILFPRFRATMAVARWEWEDAISGAPELRGAYPPEHILPHESSGRLRLVEDNEEIVPGLRVPRSGGHTRGHHTPTFTSNGQTAVYLGDLCPTSTHMPSHWNMGYDVYPLDTRRKKPELLAQAADNEWLILWDHDPDMAAARIARDPKREFIVAERIERL